MMLRILLGGLAIAACMPSVITETSAASRRSLPMQFEWRNEGPADVCGTQCRTWVSAIGAITPDTPNDFAEFTKRHDLHGATLVLDSGGGSVHGAMALGRQIRRLAMTTTVGRTIELPARGGTARARLSPKADCESMCAFVLLAGTTRIVPQGARLLVHQIWLGDRRDDAAAATYSAEDLVLVQRDIGRLAQYTIEMGGSIDFLELSLRIPPWEPMRVLARDEIRRMHVETAPEAAPPPVATAAATAASSPALTSGTRRGPDAAARGWVVTEQSGQPMLIRSHPLTIEGEEIGSFDLTLTCSATQGALAVDYRELRQVTGGKTSPLKSVALSLNTRSESLQVVSSELVSESSELSSRARGEIPASFIRQFSETSSRALLVSTVDVNGAHTAIRVGNSGVAAALAQVQQSCGSRPMHATNARTGQAAAR
jgi:hypothetical protein